jgi:hypothetical protein
LGAQPPKKPHPLSKSRRIAIDHSLIANNAMGVKP